MKTLFLSCVLTCMLTSCTGQNDAPFIPGEVALRTGKNIWVIFEDSKKNFWFGSDGDGVYRYDGKTLLHMYSRQGLAGERIREIKEDKLGNIYINTLEGISKFDGKKFTTILPVKNKNNKWKSEPDDLWFKGEPGKNGPYRYDGKHLYSLEFPKHYLEDEYHRKYPKTFINPYELYYIYKDSKGVMWFGTGAFGVYRYDGTSLRNLYEEHLTLPEGGGSFGIRSIIEDRNGQYWFCNTKYRYNILPGESPEKGKGYINYSKKKGFDVTNDPLGGDRIYFQSVAEDSNGDLWLQTYTGGIWRYDGSLHHYPVKDGNDDANVISMYQDSKGVLWLGTNGSGVYRFNGRAFEKFKF